MIDENNLLNEDNKPPGLNNLFITSFFNLDCIEPVNEKNDLWQVKQQDLTVRIETDLDICKELFEKFSPKKTLFELWGFRYAFYLGYECKPQPVFLLIEKNGEPLGLLPLWYEKEKDELRWFGSWWQEGNTFWIKQKSLIPIILSFFPQKILLNALEVPPKTAEKLGLLEDDPKYLLSLMQYPTIDSFLERFKAKKKYNLKRDQKIIQSKNPKTIHNRFDDIEKLFEISIKRFEGTDDSSAFTSEERRQTFREIVTQGTEYEPRIVTTEIDGEIVGVDIVAIHKGTYYALNGAYNLEKHPGLGNYTNLLLIQDAINLGCKAVDFLEVSYGWKEDWFEPILLFQYKGLKDKSQPSLENS